MKKIIKVIAWFALIAAAGYGLMHYYQHMLAEDKSSAERNGSEKRESPRVRTITIERDTLEQRASVTGTIQPDARATVMSEVSGVLETFRLSDETPVEEGLEVGAGERIGVVEHEDLTAAVDEAETSLLVAESSLEEARVELKDARREKKRVLALYKDGTATEQRRDKVLTAHESAQARVDLARNRVRQAEAALKKARVRYHDATITAPTNGIITTKHVDEGSYVTPSTPLLEICDIEYVEAQGGIAGKYIPLIKPGETGTEIRVDAYPDDTFHGHVDRLQPQLTASTRTAKITVRIENEDHRLRPGMYARMELIVQRRDNVPTIPDYALVQKGDDRGAFVIKDGKARFLKVELGLKEGARNEILSGLSEGDRIVARGHHLLEDGMEINVEEKDE
ncbi:MAG: efflux RND transporter periplasmic adaptor subunit [Planctomycetota bacterium]